MIKYQHFIITNEAGIKSYRRKSFTRLIKECSHFSGATYFQILRKERYVCAYVLVHACIMEKRGSKMPVTAESG